MNRELKFRAWDTFLNHYINPKYETLLIIPNGFGSYGDRYIWEQYTGLKDKNGKEIYEGDIIHEKWYDKETHIKQDRIGKVEYFCDGFTCWFRGFYKELGMFPTKNIEVIGNIHENPELCNKEK